MRSQFCLPVRFDHSELQCNQKSQTLPNRAFMKTDHKPHKKAMRAVQTQVRTGVEAISHRLLCALIHFDFLYKTSEHLLSLPLWARVCLCFKKCCIYPLTKLDEPVALSQSRATPSQTTLTWLRRATQNTGGRETEAISALIGSALCGCL